MAINRRGFAQGTKVPVDQTRLEIERTLRRYGADRFMNFVESGRAGIVFELADRRVRFDLKLPTDDDDRARKEQRRLWRALLLCIKSKLESVDSGIESFEEAFLSHVVMPDGKTVADHALPAVKAIYQSGEMALLLPPGRNDAA